MAKMYFKYGTMNSGKSIELLKTKHNYEEQGKAVLVFTSGKDDRYGQGKVSTRIGLSCDAHMIFDDTNITKVVKDSLAYQNKNLYCILVDEAQFLTKENVKELKMICLNEDVPIICFGLKNDFQNNLFEGSAALLAYSENLVELKTVCWFCEKKATMVLRRDEKGNPIYVGDQVVIGGNDKYIPVCHKHYLDPDNK